MSKASIFFSWLLHVITCMHTHPSYNNNAINQMSYHEHTSAIFLVISYMFSPFDPCDEEHQIAIDFGAVDKLVNVVGVHCLSCL